MKKISFLIVTFLLLSPFKAGAQDIPLDSLFDIFIKTGIEVKNELSKATELTDEEEMSYGNKLADGFNKQVSFTKKGLDKVTSIAEKLLNYIERKNITYKIRIIDSPNLNALSIAGGNIYLTTGIIDFVRSEDELAFVIAHEIGHEDKKHCMHNVQLAALASTIGGSDAEYYAQLASTIANMPFSKYQEFEADEAGATLLYESGYDPKAGIEFFNKLSLVLNEENEKGDVLNDFFRSHPYSSDRSQNLQNYIETNLK